jgi:dihydrofolate synthase / folylpolyglutamate synthase
VDASIILNRLYSLAPKGITLGLDRVERAAALLGNPQDDIYCVQIAGTNGKGTVSATLAHALSRSGIRTGLFTSPHLHRFSERIRIDDNEVSRPLLEKHLETVLNLNDEHPDLSLSFFEIATLAALLIFKETKTDVAVLEAGLGGRLDATSIARPKLTAVTSVSLDHTALLGDTVEKIAAEKAAIARPGVPMVTGALSSPALLVVEKTCKNIGAPMRFLNRDFFIDETVHPPWPGAHQAANVATAAELFRLMAATDARIRPAAFAEALPSVFWPGRFEIIQKSRRYILDCAHNMEAAQALVRTLAETGEHPDVLLYGALRDKPAKQMLALYRPLVRRVVLMPPPIDRAQDPAALAGPEDVVVADASQGLFAAEKACRQDGTVLVTGSVFTAADIRKLLLDEPADSPVGL